MRLQFTTVLLLTLLSSGCSTLEKIEARHEQAMFDAARSQCVKYGFREGSEAFTQCLQTEVNGIKTREAIENAAASTRSAIESEASRTPRVVESGTVSPGLVVSTR